MVSLRQSIERSWLTPNVLTCFLWPLSILYAALFAVRGWCYKIGFLSRFRAPVPVIVIGNITVGGTGKTPLLIHVVNVLKQQGYTPGVISRGYGGKANSYPYHVTDTSPVFHSGDEPALIVRRTQATMMVGADRKASILALLKINPNIDVIVSDDGLQHLALQRDIEICLVDATSPHTSPYLLPAGPFRESLPRLNSVDMVVKHALPHDKAGQFAMTLSPRSPRLVQSLSVSSDHTEEPIFDASGSFHAVAGIGNPKRFFDTCLTLGYRFIEHSFADHHVFTESELNYDGKPVLMTEKDAVKCQHFANTRHWYLPVDATLSSDFNATLLNQLALLKQA